MRPAGSTRRLSVMVLSTVACKTAFRSWGRSAEWLRLFGSSRCEDRCRNLVDQWYRRIRFSTGFRQMGHSDIWSPHI